MKKRKKVKLVSFLSVLILSLCVWGITKTVKADTLQKTVNAENEKALTQLCEYFDSIETSLMKSVYTGDTSSMCTLTSSLQRSCTGAKECLADLSAGSTQLVNINKFLSQTGDYTLYLNKKAASGYEITSQERETLKTLAVYASTLSMEFEQMAMYLTSGYFTFEKLSDEFAKADSGSESPVSYMDNISDAELSFGDFPTLLYDGPFSDNITKKESELLKNADEISLDTAKEKAARLLGTDSRMLLEEGTAGGKIEVFCFRSDLYSVTVTKKGGYPLEIISEITAGEERLSFADAIKSAVVFLNSAGFTDMVSTYYMCSDGICTINFAYKQGSFICYPDLIKVSVSLTDGKVTGFEATDYIMNHKTRNIPPFEVTPQEVCENVISLLTVEKVSAAVIPTDSGSEKYVYELLCSGDDGQDILVYKDITTGKEEDILILLYSDNGTLTK